MTLLNLELELDLQNYSNGCKIPEADLITMAGRLLQSSNLAYVLKPFREKSGHITLEVFDEALSIVGMAVAIEYGLFKSRETAKEYIINRFYFNKKAFSHLLPNAEILLFFLYSVCKDPTVIDSRFLELRFGLEGNPVIFHKVHKFLLNKVNLAYQKLIYVWEQLEDADIIPIISAYKLTTNNVFSISMETWLVIEMFHIQYNFKPMIGAGFANRRLEFNRNWGN